MSAPRSTYRVQVSGAFPLADMARIVPYLHDLSVDAVYCSPLLTSGSAHGYDVVAHDQIDPERGGRAGLDLLAEALRANGMGLVLDIVPNHVSVEHAWFRDVREHGRESRYAHAFDVDWAADDGEALPFYRRFFDVSDLAGLRVEDPGVFEESHRLVLDLVREGIVTGLRVDHPDGLADPRGYLARLRDAVPGTWTVVEKIEPLPDDWPADGTTGYDALADVTALFVDRDGLRALTAAWHDFTGDDASWAEVVAESKRLVLTEILAEEVAWLHRLVPHEPQDAIVELLVALDTYRTDDPAVLDAAVARVPEPHRAAAARLAALVAEGGEFATRFQQVSGPAYAKGVEDTACYRYVPLASLAEVGLSPDHPGRLRGDYGMTTLSTHDTKRSEDVRARLSLLAEIPEEWAAAVRRWHATNARHGDVGRDMEWLLYQTFVGAYPLDVERATAYALKAAREAKRHTSWLEPDETYERTLDSWVRKVLGDNGFQQELAQFVQPLVAAGWTVSLAQKLVQLTLPGVPDVYQGTEVWDYSLVDPDNRRPVDYDRRTALLAELDTLTVEEIQARAGEGLPKLLVTARALRLRRERPEAFETYAPLDVTGAWADRVVAFGREVVTVVPRCALHVTEWKDTRVALPPGDWYDVLSGADVVDDAVEALLARFPVALLVRR